MPPFPLTHEFFFSWNCRGMGHPDSLWYIKRMVSLYNPNVLFLIETKADKRRMEKICRILKFHNFVIVKACALARGFTFTWLDEMTIEHIWNSTNIIRLYSLKKLDAIAVTSSSVLWCSLFRREKEFLGRIGEDCRKY